ncbi:hypothetical protein NKH48_15035 [Mesorhizobium sp. M1233]|uniref:hypothetical protein n=1 Tax=Mesorhizobium sp. M1233 TaxID=2957072 RepID=UPI0033357E26
MGNQQSTFASCTYRGVDGYDLGQTATLLGKQALPCGVVAIAWLVTATLKKNGLSARRSGKTRALLQPAKWPTSPAKGGKQA